MENLIAILTLLSTVVIGVGGFAVNALIQRKSNSIEIITHTRLDRRATTQKSLIVVCIVIIGIALLQTACMYLYIEWVGYICPTHIYVELDIKDDDKEKTEYNVNGENKKKQILYPLYEVENGMLMCKIKSDKKEDLYIRISKNKLKNIPIHVKHGDDSIEADSEDNETQKEVDKKAGQ